MQTPKKRNTRPTRIKRRLPNIPPDTYRRYLGEISEWNQTERP